jgi:hypothetical protein
MCPMLIEILISLAKLAVHPETPFSFLTTSYHQGPTATLIYPHRVLMCGGEPTNCPRLHHYFTIRVTINIAALKNTSNVPPGMVVKMPLVVRRQPMMNTYREEIKVEYPTSHVRAFFSTKLLSPSNHSVSPKRALSFR